MIPRGAIASRFAADLDGLIAPGERIGMAVSGGPDSVALLLLAAAVRPGGIEAATVDHRLRVGSSGEAETVARICAGIAIPHATLPVEWRQAPSSNIQSEARDERYHLLARWAAERGIAAVATAHHLDDQAETLLMRLARGSGIGGLAGIRRSRKMGNGVRLVRPLLGWRREELRQIVHNAGIDPISDASNSDRRFDRTHARETLAASELLDPARLAAVADHAADAEEALEWMAREALGRAQRAGTALILDPAGLPRELRRRLLAGAIGELSEDAPPGPKLMAALDTLEQGGVTTLAGLKLEGGVTWRLSPAPPRRSRPFSSS